MVENGSLFVETPAAIYQATFELFDMSGHRLQTETWTSLQGKQSVNIGANGKLPANAYFVRLSNTKTTLAKQLIVIK